MLFQFSSASGNLARSWKVARCWPGCSSDPAPALWGNIPIAYTGCESYEFSVQLICWSFQSPIHWQWAKTNNKSWSTFKYYFIFSRGKRNPSSKALLFSRNFQKFLLNKLSVYIIKCIDFQEFFIRPGLFFFFISNFLSSKTVNVELRPELC